MKLAFRIESRVPSPMWVGIIQPTVGLNWAEGRGEDPAYCRTVGAGTWVFPGPALHLTPSGPLLLRPFSLHWNYTTGFPGPPACKWQIVRLSSLHSCVSQSLINLFLYISTHPIVILFLWGTLANTRSELNMVRTNIKSAESTRLQMSDTKMKQQTGSCESGLITNHMLWSATGKSRARATVSNQTQVLEAAFWKQSSFLTYSGMCFLWELEPIKNA